jgi:hypothetical protein
LVARMVRCGALYLLAACPKASSREVHECLEKALELCDEMDVVNGEEGVSVEMVPYTRVSAMREQLLKLKSSNSMILSQDIVASRTVPTSSTTPPRYPKKRARLLTPPPTTSDEFKRNTDSDSSTTSFTTAPLCNISDRVQPVPHIDRCHIAELEFELSRARDEENKAKRWAHQAREKREGIEERIKTLRNLSKLQKI